MAGLGDIRGIELRPLTSAQSVIPTAAEMVRPAIWPGIAAATRAGLQMGQDVRDFREAPMLRALETEEAQLRLDALRAAPGIAAEQLAMEREALAQAQARQAALDKIAAERAKYEIEQRKSQTDAYRALARVRDADAVVTAQGKPVNVASRVRNIPADTVALFTTAEGKVEPQYGTVAIDAATGLPVRVNPDGTTLLGRVVPITEYQASLPREPVIDPARAPRLGLSPEVAAQAVSIFDDNQARAWNDYDKDVRPQRTQLAEQLTGANRVLKLLESGVKTGWYMQVPIIGDLITAADDTGRLGEFRAIVNDMLGQVRPAGSGATSDYEQRIYQTVVPQLGQNPAANRFIASAMARDAQRQLEEIAFFDRARANKIPIEQARLEWQNYKESIPTFVPSDESDPEAFFVEGVGYTRVNTAPMDYRQWARLKRIDPLAPNAQEMIDALPVGEKVLVLGDDGVFNLSEVTEQPQ